MEHMLAHMPISWWIPPVVGLGAGLLISWEEAFLVPIGTLLILSLAEYVLEPPTDMHGMSLLIGFVVLVPTLVAYVIGRAVREAVCWGVARSRRG